MLSAVLDLYQHANTYTIIKQEPQSETIVNGKTTKNWQLSEWR